MNDVVNLNKARKAKAAADRKQQAAENRVRFGRTKAEKTLESARTEKARLELEAKKRGD
jgi:hypothetical protein